MQTKLVDEKGVGLRRRRLGIRDGLLLRKGTVVDSWGRENRAKEENLGRLGDKDENFGFRMDFILQLQSRNGNGLQLQEEGFMSV